MAVSVILWITFVPLLIALGACLWVSVTAKWPGAQRRVPPMARVALSLLPVGVNGSVAVAYGFMTADPYVGTGNTATGAISGLGVFLGAFVVEGVSFLLVVGAVRLIGNGRAHQSGENASR